jgi:hypothetical protein
MPADTISAFEHLSVLISIVIGMGLAHLLISVQRLVQARDRVSSYWLSVLWTVLIFVTLIEWWWASFSFRDRQDWNFFYFLFILMSPISLYLAAAFVLPWAEDGRIYDLRDYYYSTRKFFFLLVAIGPTLDAIRRAGQAGSITNFGAISNAIAAVLVGSLAFSEKPWHHTIVTLFVTGLFGMFIVSEAIKLT